MFILPDFPENSSNWLTPAEKALALERVARDTGDISVQNATAIYGTSSGKLLGRWPGLYLAVTDWKVWWLAVALFFMVAALSFGVYFPTLAATMGYGPIVSLLLCAPPWLFATAVALVVSR